MVVPAVGEVVLVPFPFSDLSQSKVRPAVCLADAGRGDWVLYQITSNPYGDPSAVPLDAPRQDEEKWTRFYLEVPTERTYYGWKEIKADFASLGVMNITPNSTRELTGKAIGILHLME